MFSLPFTLDRSIFISKPKEEVFQTIADFHTWKQWSPWLCQEPECVLTITNEAKKVGHKQKWDGQRIGQGEMTLVSMIPNESIEYDLLFLKPWKSHSTVKFIIQSSQETGDTKVTWTMQGTLPIFIFFLKGLMSALVGNDYERGLGMLKEYMETGHVPSQTRVEGEAQLEEFYYIGKTRECETKDLPNYMPIDFQEIEKLLQENKIPKPDTVISFYHKFDIKNKKCHYTSGFGYKNPPQLDSIASHLSTGKVSAHKGLKVEHIGPYRFLGNAWSTAMGLQRHLKKKAFKSVPMYEIYKNNPHIVPEEQLITEIILPIH